MLVTCIGVVKELAMDTGVLTLDPRLLGTSLKSNETELKNLVPVLGSLAWV